MKRTLLALAACAMLAACTEPALKQEQTDNDRFDVELLFTIKGCEVYRFRDFRNHYVTLCPNSTVSSTARSGKTDYDDSIPTVGR